MPDVAERQPWPLVRAVIDYRLAREAFAAFNDPKNGFKTLSERPELMEILLRMHRAQSETLMTADELLASMPQGEGEDD